MDAGIMVYFTIFSVVDYRHSIAERLYDYEWMNPAINPNYLLRCSSSPLRKYIPYNANIDVWYINVSIVILSIGIVCLGCYRKDRQ